MMILDKSTNLIIVIISVKMMMMILDKSTNIIIAIISVKMMMILDKEPISS